MTTPIKDFGLSLLADAESIGAPEGPEYIALMEFIQEEAKNRLEAFKHHGKKALYTDWAKMDDLARQARYLDNPGLCPRCQSSDITGDSIDVDGETVTQSVCCSTCDFEWIDSYRLESFLPMYADDTEPLDTPKDVA